MGAGEWASTMSILGGAGTSSSRSLLGVIGGVVGGIGGFITGGPGGAVAGATAGREIGDAINGPSGGPPVGGGAVPATGFTGIGGQVGGGSGGCAAGDYMCLLKAAGGIFGFGSSSPGTAVACTPKGYHLNKQTLNPTRGGCGRVAHGVIPKHTVPVRNRHMNAGNAKAARRAVHRLKSAHRLFKHIDRIVGRKSSRVGRSTSCGCKKR